MIKLDSKIYLAGHKGLVGSAILRKLKKKGYKNIICQDREKLDLTNQKKVYKFLKKINQRLFLLLQLKLEEFSIINYIKQIILLRIY